MIATTNAGNGHRLGRCVPEQQPRASSERRMGQIISFSVKRFGTYARYWLFFSRLIASFRNVIISTGRPSETSQIISQFVK
jgi:hypothetical protein